MSASDAPHPLEEPGFASLPGPGEIVDGKYEIVRLIGEGGMGSVFLTRHVSLGREFAIKFLKPALTQDERAMARFRREARLVGGLNHDYIVGAVDLGVTDLGVPYLVMEHVDGVTLREVLTDRAPLPIPRAVRLALDVCHGLHAAHAAGVVHRDLKPANLFVVHRSDGREECKLLDFGIAKDLERSGTTDETRSGARLGTLSYMSPEQAKGDGDVDQRTDIYSLGAILYEALSGKRPHDDSRDHSLLYKIVHEEPEPLDVLRPEIPPDLQQAIHQALAKEPDERPPNVADLARRLVAFGGSAARVPGQLTPLRAAAPVRSVGEGRDAVTADHGDDETGPASSRQVEASVPPRGASGKSLAAVAAVGVVVGSAVTLSWGGAREEPLRESSPRVVEPTVEVQEEPAADQQPQPETTSKAAAVEPAPEPEPTQPTLGTRPESPSVARQPPPARLAPPTTSATAASVATPKFDEENPYQ